MDSTTKNIAKNAEALSVSMGKSRYGTPEPQIELRYPRHMSWRALHAALHSLAARVELDSPRNEYWCVQIEKGDVAGRVYLELAKGTADEARRGLDVLRKVVAS